MNCLKALFTSKAVLASTAVAAVALAPEAMAGTGGTEFDDIYTLLVGWTQGTLGKIIALGMFMAGLFVCRYRQPIYRVCCHRNWGCSGAVLRPNRYQRRCCRSDLSPELSPVLPGTGGMLFRCKLGPKKAASLQNDAAFLLPCASNGDDIVASSDEAAALFQTQS